MRKAAHKQSYGGFLPLELNRGDEWFKSYVSNLLRFNSVKASISYIIRYLKIKKIQLPYYYCPTTIEAIKAMGVEIDFYHIDGKLCVTEYKDNKECAIIVVDYFGIMKEQVQKLLCEVKHAYVILDFAHDFFATPIMADRVWNIYSARKFFGVPDGAYLISTDLIPIHQDMQDAFSYSLYLLKSYEAGTDAAYNDKKKTDDFIADNYGSMSKLTIGLLKNVDYKSVLERRSENFEFLLNSFRDCNSLDICEQSTPAYIFPLYLPNVGASIKKQLVIKHIYVPTLWKGKDLLEQGTQKEISFSEDTVFLPIDQRYDIYDMEYIAKEVKGLL